MKYENVKAWLHRKGSFCWEFTPSKRYGFLTHVTRFGNVYAIIHDKQYHQPFWIARRIDDKWYAVERELKALKIEFSTGGEYFFQKNQSK